MYLVKRIFMGVMTAITVWAWALWVAAFLALAVVEMRWAARGDAGVQGRLTTNFGLGLSGFAMAFVPMGAGVGAGWAEAEGFGLFQWVNAPVAAMVLTTILIRSFAFYWLHRLSHRFDPLWRLHRVHHSDAAVDLSTSVRNHPGEWLLSLAMATAVALLLGAPVELILSVELLFALANLVGHVDLALPVRVERVLAMVLVTPGFHLVHHSRARARHDGHYGELLTIWDRLFGTLDRSGDAVGIGLDGWAVHHHRLHGALLSPLASARPETVEGRAS